MLKQRTKEELNQRSLYRNAKTMFLILDAYIPFFQMMEERKASLVKNTYKDAENVCSLIRGLLKTDCRPEDFFGKEDEHSNNAIEHYEELVEKIGNHDEFTRGSLLAFYNYIYHNFISVSFSMGGYLTHPDSLVAFICYAEGEITLEHLKSTFIEISLFTQSVKIVDSRFFRQDMIKLSTIYHQIWCKRKERLNKCLMQKLERNM